MKPNEIYTSHCCKKKEVSVYATANIQWSESILDLGKKFRRETILRGAPKHDMRKKIYKEMAHQHLIESLGRNRLKHFDMN